jgi:hypothetical protein
MSDVALVGSGGRVLCVSQINLFKVDFPIYVYSRYNFKHSSPVNATVRTAQVPQRCTLEICLMLLLDLLLLLV